MVLSERFLHFLLYKLRRALFGRNISYSVISSLYQKFGNFFHGCERVASKHIELLANCCMLYIDCIQKHINNTPIRGNGYIETLREFIRVVRDIFQLEGVQDVYLTYISIPIFEKVTEPNIKIWFAKELLKNFNLAVKRNRRYILYMTAENHPLNYLGKLVNLICTCGDYGYQRLLLETIFLMFSEAQINQYAGERFPSSFELRNGLCRINKDNFDIDCRAFLNMLNSNIKNVLSLKCDIVLLGNMRVSAPKILEQDELPIWADFNLQTRTISMFCDKNSLRNYPAMENSVTDDSIELITINIEDISSVLASGHWTENSAVSVGSRILFNLTSACSFTSVEVAKATQLKLAICNCPELNTLVTILLPEWFGEKFKLFPPLVEEDSELHRQNRLEIDSRKEPSPSYIFGSLDSPGVEVQKKAPIKSSTFYTQLLKNRLIAHQAGDIIQSKKKGIEEESSLVAKLPENLRILTKEANSSIALKSPKDVDGTSDDIFIENGNRAQKENINSNPCARKDDIIKVMLSNKASVGKSIITADDRHENMASDRQNEVHQNVIQHQKTSVGKFVLAEDHQTMMQHQKLSMGKSILADVNVGANKKTRGRKRKIQAITLAEKGSIETVENMRKKIIKKETKKSTETEAVVTTETAYSNNPSTLNILIPGNISGHTEQENSIKDTENILSDTTNLAKNTDSSVYKANHDLEVNKSIVEQLATENLDQEDSDIEVIDLTSDTMELEETVPAQPREIFNYESGGLNSVAAEHGNLNDVMRNIQLEERNNFKVSMGIVDIYKKYCQPKKRVRRKTKKTKRKKNLKVTRKKGRFQW